MPAVIDRRGLRRLLDEENAQLVEVLPPGEYDEEHLPGAVHLPLKQLDAHAAARTLDPGRPVVVYCWDGL
jgi:rhodanese-related sulfurtransferase